MLENSPETVQLVRNLMGAFSASIPDEVLVNDTVLAVTADQIIDRYPEAEAETDPDRIARIERAQAYLLAARVISVTSDKVQTRLGDMTITENVPTATLFEDWTQEAWALLRRLYPGASITSSLFTVAPGLRGGGNRRGVEGSDRRW